MKKLFLLLAVASLFAFDAQAQVQYKVVTVIESIVPAGIGRSRIIEEKQDINSGDFTTTRTDGKTSNQDDVRRKDLKVDAFEETKLLNFFSLGGSISRTWLPTMPLSPISSTNSPPMAGSWPS